MHDVVGVVVVHGDLLEDHATLGLDVGRPDQRRGDHVARARRRRPAGPVEHPRVEAGVLLGGEGVHLPAHGVERRGDVQARRDAAVPLNSRCSRKWARPRLPRRLVTGADAHPEPEARPSGRVGIASVMTRRPPGRTVRRTSPPSASRCSVRVVPGSLAGPEQGSHSTVRRRASAGVSDSSTATGQGQLAARVDLADLDLDLLADLHDVLDVLDALAAGQLAQLRDVQQAVLARQQRHEGAERGGLHHGAQVALADLRHLRVGDAVDDRERRLRLRPVGRADVDRAVVLDGDVGAGVLLDLVDDLALRPDHLADLVDRDPHRDDPRRELAHLVRGVDRLEHHVEDRQAGVLGLRERPGEDGCRDAVELGVQLQRGDEVPRAGDLEVHVAVRVLGPEDVGQRDVARSRRRPRR